MAKHRGGFTEETIKNRIKEGRGFGKCNEYLPWITVRDLPSQGRCSEICGWKTNRVHQFLSDLETSYFYMLEFSSEVIDIREQFPLLDERNSNNETIKIAESIGVKYPVVPKTGTYNIQTTDFLITIQADGKSEVKARTIKYAKELSNKRTIEKLEIERLFWENRGVDWKIVTELDIDRIYSFNVEFVHNAHSLIGSNFDFNKVVYVENALRHDLLDKSDSLANITQNIDMRLGLSPGETLFCVKYLIANKFWIIDMKKKINTNDLLIVKEFKNLIQIKKEH